MYRNTEIRPDKNTGLGYTNIPWGGGRELGERRREREKERKRRRKRGEREGKDEKMGER